MLPGDYSLGARRPILLIESDPSYAALLKAAFSKANVRNAIEIVADAHAAVAYLNRFKSHTEPQSPALVILALASHFDCSAMVRWLRRQPHLLHVPCVVFGGEPALAKNRAPRELVCDCYLRKPGDFSSLTSFASGIRDKWLLPGEKQQRRS